MHLELIFSLPDSLIYIFNHNITFRNFLKKTTVTIDRKAVKKTTVEADQVLTTGPVVVPPLHDNLLVGYLERKISQNASTSPDAQNIQLNFAPPNVNISHQLCENTENVPV